MGLRGPAPKDPSAVVGHRTRAELEARQSERLTYEDEVVPPGMPLATTYERDDAGAFVLDADGQRIVASRRPAWHPIAVRVYEAALASPLRRYWLDSDWALILSACDALSGWHAQHPDDRKPGVATAAYKELSFFGFDLAARRRAGIHVERANSSPASVGPVGVRPITPVTSINRARSLRGSGPQQ